MNSLKHLLLALVPILLPACAAHGVAAEGVGERVLVNVDSHGLALGGYDPVAYFTDSKPVEGLARFQSQHEGAYYRFASAEHKALFDASPAKFAPAYGGYCGYAASIDRLSPIDPKFFQLLGGRLVLQHNQRAFDKWNADVAGNLVKADTNWPGLVARNGLSSKHLVNVDTSGVAIGGYDPIAYFVDGAPKLGDPAIEATYGGARYHFASQEHREMFERDPARYAPSFGGYCGYAASINKLSPIDPLIWQILDGRLVLQHTKKAYELFNKDAKAALARADGNWPELVHCNGV